MRATTRLMLSAFAVAAMLPLAAQAQGISSDDDVLHGSLQPLDNVPADLPNSGGPPPGYAGYAGYPPPGYSGYAPQSGYGGYAPQSGYAGNGSSPAYPGYAPPAGYSGYAPPLPPSGYPPAGYPPAYRNGGNGGYPGYAGPPPGNTPHYGDQRRQGQDRQQDGANRNAAPVQAQRNGNAAAPQPQTNQGRTRQQADAATTQPAPQQH